MDPVVPSWASKAMDHLMELHSSPNYHLQHYSVANPRSMIQTPPMVNEYVKSNFPHYLLQPVMTLAVLKWHQYWIAMDRLRVTHDPMDLVPIIEERKMVVIRISSIYYIQVSSRFYLILRLCHWHSPWITTGL